MKHIVLLHGALGHPAHFDKIKEYFPDDVTLHSILFHGHGGSDIPEKGIHMEDYVQQLADYCMIHQLEDTHIFGYSMGGYAGLVYASRFPGKVSSVLTMATKLDWTEEGALKEAAMLDPDIIEKKVPKFAEQLAALHGDRKWKELLPAIKAMMQELGKAPLLLEKDLNLIRSKVQLMVGDRDTMVSIDETLRASQRIADARFAVLPGTPHPLEKVRTDLLVSLMKDFWGDILF